MNLWKKILLILSLTVLVACVSDEEVEAPTPVPTVENTESEPTSVFAPSMRWGDLCGWSDEWSEGIINEPYQTSTGAWFVDLVMYRSPSASAPSDYDFSYRCRNGEQLAYVKELEITAEAAAEILGSGSVSQQTSIAVGRLGEEWVMAIPRTRFNPTSVDLSCFGNDC